MSDAPKFKDLAEAEENYQLALKKALELDSQCTELRSIALNARILLTSPANKAGRKLIVDDLISRIDAVLNGDKGRG